MVKTQSLADFLLPEVVSVEELRRDPAKSRKIKSYFVDFLLQGVKKDGAFLALYHVRSLQDAAKERFPTEWIYFGKNFFFSNNPSLQEAIRKRGAAPLRISRMSGLANYHPDHKKDSPIIIPNNTEGNLGIYYSDMRRAGKYIASICDKKSLEDGRQFITLKPEYSQVLFRMSEEEYA